MASASSSGAASSSASNRAAVMPVMGWPHPPPPPPAVAQAHAVFVQELFRDPARRRYFQLPNVCRAIIWGILLFLAVASFSVLMWLLFHPTSPQIYVTSASISAVSIANSVAKAECKVTLLLTNPNRHLSAVYDQIQISLEYPSQHVVLAEDYPHPFVQPSSNRTAIETNLSFTEIDLGHVVVKALEKDLGHGTLSFGLKIVANVRYRNGKWKTKTQYMMAYCGGVSFAFTSNDKPGIFLNPYQECEVYLYSK